LPIEERFRILYRLGTELRAAGDWPAFARLMQELNGRGQAGTELIGKVALCRGLLGQSTDAATIEADYRRLLEFAGISASPPVVSIEQRPDTLNFDAIKAYAASLGLDRFVLAGGDAAAEYAAGQSEANASYQETGRSVRVANDRNDRSRIKAPFRLFGHVVCTKPENVHGIYWCFDLLRSGYAFVHVPAPMGPEKKSLAGQFARNILGRCGLTVGSLRNPRPVLREMKGRFDEKKMTVEVDLAEDLLVQADPSLLQIVFENLLSNAAKYGREGALVRIFGRRLNGFTELHVWNEGQGVPADQVDELFRKFSRLQAPRSQVRGTGLGLFITREIVRTHGGDIRAESEHGRWIDFIFSLPRPDAMLEERIG